MSAKKHNHSGSSKMSQKHAPARPRARKKSTVLNWRVLVWTLVGLVAGGGGAWLWHAWQVKDFAGGAIEQGKELSAKAEDLATLAGELIAQARDLEAEARDLQSQGKINEAQGRRDEAQELFEKARSQTEEAFGARQAAMRYYLRYTELNPDDPEGPLSIARLSEKNGNLPAAIEWYATALRAAESQADGWPKAAEVRNLRAERLLAWGQAYQQEASRTGKQEYRDGAAARFRQAQEEAATVLDEENVEPENEAKARRTLALALFGLNELEERESTASEVKSIGEALEEAFQQNTSDPELALALARVYRQFPELLSDDQLASFSPASEEEQKRQAAADKVMRQLVETVEQDLSEAADSDEARAQAANARLSRYRYLSIYGLPDADADLKRALELAPNSANVHLLAGWRLIQEATSPQSSEPHSLVVRKEKLDEARQHFLTAKDSEFGNVAAYLGLAEVYRRLGNIDEAVNAYRLGLQNVGETDWELNVGLISSLVDAQKLTQEEADKLFKALDDGLAALRLRLSDSVRRSREARRDLLRARWLAQSKDYQAAADLLDRILTERTLIAPNQEAGQSVNRDEIRARLLLAGCYEAQARQKLTDAAQGAETAAAMKTTPDADAAAQSPQISAAAKSARDEGKILFGKAAQVYQELARDLPLASQLRETAGKLLLAAGQPDMAVLDLQKAIELDDSIGLQFLLVRARLEQAKSTGLTIQFLGAVQEELNDLENRVQQEPDAQAWAVDVMRAELLTLKADGDDSKGDTEQTLAALREIEEKYPLSIELQVLLVRRYQELGAKDDLDRVSTSREIARAFAAGRPADAAVPEDILKALVGEEAVLWRFYRSNRLLMEPAGQPKERNRRLDEAKQLSEGILKERPEWTQAHLLAASVQRADGNLVDAVQNLEKAHKLEPANLRILEQLVRIQLQVGQAEQAETLLDEAGERFPGSDAILQLQMLLKRSSGDRESAIELARQDVANRPRDVSARMRLGTLLQESGEIDEAEEVLRGALLMEPGNAGAMTALFALYGQSDKKEQAEAMLEDLAANEQLKPWQKELVLARGYEALDLLDNAKDRYAKAENKYRSAIETAPDDVALRLELVDLLLRGDDPSRFDAAEEELQKTLKTVPASPEARRALARILWLRNKGDDRQQALAMTKSLSVDEGSADDRYRHGLMLESMGEFEAAGEVLDEVIASTSLRPDALAAQIRRNIRTGQLAKAEAELARLEKMAPDAHGTVALKILLLHEADRDSEIEAVVGRMQERLGKVSNTADQETSVSQIIGDLYSSVDMHAKAEPHYRKSVESNPSAIGRLAACLAALGQTKEAVEMVLAGGEEVEDLAKAEALARIFVTARPSDEEWSAAEPVLKAVAEAHKDRGDVLTTIANVYIVRGQIDQAVALLEQALAIVPENLVILNNLATMLGEQPGRAEDALRYANRAIELSGSSPNLLDTKGTILIHLNRADEAVAVLDTALKGNVQDPRYMLHLAVACDRVGDVTRAKEMLQKALQDGLLERPSLILTGKDRGWIERLKKKHEQ